VVSRFNHEMTQTLVKEAISALTEGGVQNEDIVVHWVPGAFEIPLALKELAEADEFDALIAQGCVITGETPHAEVINVQIARAICDLSIEYQLPIIDTIVAAHTMEQAEARIMSGRESRGWYGAKAAMEMVTLLPNLRGAE
jgi:6,7-dimethyl-8-ribityllumazine synthase